MPYAEYAKLLGLAGIYCDTTKDVAAAWSEALSSKRPVVLEFKVDQEAPPIPPHIKTLQAKKAAKANVKDPGRTGVIATGMHPETHRLLREAFPRQVDQLVFSTGHT